MSSEFIKIDKAQWDRLPYYDFFNGFHDPSYSMTKEYDITFFFNKHKSIKTLPIALTHMVATAVNIVPEFKQRDLDDEIIQWNTISPSLTVKNKIGHFSFCHIQFDPEFTNFRDNFFKALEKASENILFDPTEPQDSNKFFMSMIPWIDFTQMTHPVKEYPVDHFPRLAVSKCRENKDGTITVAVNCQVNHKFIDGQHLGHFFQSIEDYIKKEEA